MKRRQIIAALGGVAGVSSLVVSSGAFNFVDVERTVSVAVADDNTAFLALSQLGDGKGFGGRSIEDGTPEEVQFSFPGVSERLNDGLGLGTDSVYEFDRDSGESQGGTPVEGLLRIKNQGTQPVEVYSKHQTTSEIEIELYAVEDPAKTALQSEPVELSVGQHVDVGFRIKTFGADVDVFDETITIVANRTL